MNLSITSGLLIIYSYRILWITGLLFLSLYSVKSQVIDYKNYNVKDGLAASEVFDIVQDQKGYLWFATESGISRYDGYSFKNYTSPKDLKDNSVMSIYVGPDNRLWFSTFNGYIGYIENGKVRWHPANNVLKKYISYSYVKNFYMDSKGSLWLTTYHQGLLLKVDTMNRVHHVIYKSLLPGSALYLKRFENNEIIYSLTNSGNNHENKLLEYHDDHIFLHSTLLNKSHFFPVANISEDEFLISLDHELISIKNDQVIFDTVYFDNKPILDLFIDQNNYLWISVFSKGVYVFSMDNLSVPLMHLFDGMNISKVLQDHEMNYWLASTSNGLFFLPSIEFKTIKESYGEKILSMDIQDDNLFYYKYSNGLYRKGLDKNPDNFDQINYDSKIGETYDLLNIYDHIWISGSTRLRYNLSGNANKLTGRNEKRYTYSFSISNDSNLLVGGKSWVEKYDLKSGTKIMDIRTVGCENRAITDDDEGNIWLGTASGLYLYKDNYLKDMGDENQVFRNRITCLQRMNDKLLIGTSSAGLIIKSSSGIDIIDFKHGLSSNYIKSMYVEGKSTVWLGTNRGLNKVNLSETGSKQNRITVYNKLKGLLAREISDIVEKDSTFYLATENGVVYFNPDRITQRLRTPVMNLEYVLINHSDTMISFPLILDHDQDDIAFHYKAISFNNNENILYKIHLEGYDQDTILTSNIVSHYTSLPPGNYVFSVQASIDRLNFSSPATIRFSIKKHFLQTNFFFILIIIIILYLIYLLFSRILSIQKRKYEVKRRILVSEQKALRMQMNPHFLFNSIGSIRRYLLENETQTADDYLTDFSNLMRMTLENSKHNFIYLNKELQTLKLYLELEKLRFYGKFDYEIILDDNIRSDEIKIPPMLIQPYLENAIKHGLLPKDDHGFIKIHFQMNKNGLLHCEIIDNGVGREMSSNISGKYKYHEPTGMKNIEERIRIFNEAYRTKMKVEITDLKENGIPLGTRISLTIYFIK